MNDIILSVIITVEFLIGFAIGRYSRDARTLEEIKKNIQKKFTSAPVGIIKRPDAQQLERLKDPKAIAEEKEMIKSLQEFPELNP